MDIVLITQRDPFYLAEYFEYLLKHLPSHSNIVGSVVFDVAPFGKRKSILEQAKETYHIFGFSFLFRYGIKFLLNKFDKTKKIECILSKYGVPVIQLEKRINHKDSIEKIKAFQPDLLISVAGNQIFKKPIIELAPKGCLNLHTALLPKYRGLMPTFWVLKNREKETGVSVFFVDKGIDSGPIIVQKKVRIGNETQAELIRLTKKIGMDAIIEAINKVHDGNFDLIENKDCDMTYYSKPTRKDVDVFLGNGKRFF